MTPPGVEARYQQITFTQDFIIILYYWFSQQCTVVKHPDINARGGKSTFFPVKENSRRCFYITGLLILRCLEVKKKKFGPHICPYQLPYPLIPPSTVVVLYSGGFWVCHRKCNKPYSARAARARWGPAQLRTANSSGDNSWKRSNDKLVQDLKGKLLNFPGRKDPVHYNSAQTSNCSL